MNAKRTTVLFAALVVSLIAMAANAAGRGPDDRAPDRPTGSAATSAVAARPGPVVVADQRGDVTRPKLDISKVEVVNRPDLLKVRVHFPGVARTYDFPTGAISVFLDTDAGRGGPEFGHFMDFWSDYRFAETTRWREHPTADWGHSPEGRCVADAGLRSDKQSRLRWFEFVVTRSDDCFTAGAVRVAVATINTGDLDPLVVYARPTYDHLIGKHAWTPWIPVAG